MFLPEFREMVRALMRKPDGRVIPLEIAALGLVGEVGEFLESLNDAVEEQHLEFGDCLWYACAIDELVPGMSISFGRTRSIGRHASKLAELVKKATWHDKPLSVTALEVLLSKILGACVDLTDTPDHAQFSSDSQRAVMRKLQNRWPLGFGVQP